MFKLSLFNLLSIFLPILSISCTFSCSSKTVIDEGLDIFYADPTIYCENEKYYLTGTRNRPPLGFVLLESTDMKTWYQVKTDSLILRAGQETFGNKGFWAPQLLKVNNEYWLTYTANEQTALAKSDSLTGKFTQSNIAPIDDSGKNIDSFLFRDDNGKWYLYHVRFDNGNFLWVAEFDPITGNVIEGTLKRCFKNDQAWEATSAYKSAPIMEGPTVIKLDGKYYLFYSANHFMSPDYAVGYAVSDSPYGPWINNPQNPIIHRSIVGENGSGHGDLFLDNNGCFQYVYHVHYSDSVVSPRRTRIIPLHLDKDSVSDIYNITVDNSRIIKPHIQNEDDE